MMTDLVTIARLEFACVLRQRWVQLFGAAFALLALGAAHAAAALTELSGPEGFERTTVTLVPLVIALVPLAALMLAAAGQVDEPGGEAFLFTQPVNRFTVVLGRWAGQSLALGYALGAGLGAGAAYLAVLAGFAGIGRYLFFIAVAALLGAAFLALGAAISLRVGRRNAALASAAFAWVLFVLVYDAAALGAAGWLTGRIGARVLCISVLGNPADLARVLTLSVAGTPHVLGAAGEAWNRFLGGPVPATVIALGGLMAWTGIALLAARRFVRGREL